MPPSPRSPAPSKRQTLRGRVRAFLKRKTVKPAAEKKTARRTAAPRQRPPVQRASPARRPPPPPAPRTTVIIAAPLKPPPPGAERSLLDRPQTVEADGRGVTVLLRRDGVYLDGIKYKVLAGGALSDEELAITGAQEQDGTWSLRCAAPGRAHAVSIPTADLPALLGNLRSGRPYRTRTAEGIPVRIERQMY